MNDSRFLPMPTYRHPNYDSDTSFENYYLNYDEEERNPAPPHHNNHQATAKADDHDHQNNTNDNNISIPKRERSAIRRRMRRHSSLWSLTAASDSTSSEAQSTTTTENTPALIVPTNGDDHSNHTNPTAENQIHRVVGSSVLFIRRVLQNSDMNRQQHRLSLPCKQVEIEPDELFTRDELEKLMNKSPVDAKLVDPRGEEFDVKLRLTMAGPSTYCYAIGKPWMTIKDENGFEAGMVLEVRVARRGDMGELCFILERVR